MRDVFCCWDKKNISNSVFSPARALCVFCTVKSQKTQPNAYQGPFRAHFNLKMYGDVYPNCIPFWNLPNLFLWSERSRVIFIKHPVIILSKGLHTVVSILSQAFIRLWHNHRNDPKYLPFQFVSVRKILSKIYNLYLRCYFNKYFNLIYHDHHFQL